MIFDHKKAIRDTERIVYVRKDQRFDTESQSVIAGKGQAIFNICWNKYRLWVKIAYQSGIVFIKGIGTHKEYEKWDIK